ncbi:YL1-domain-containing protein, partial [Karstenula rhodostoma CBS 690.94]
MDDAAVDDHDGGRSTPEGDSEPEAPVDLMVVSRARRSNAGNRMSTLLATAAGEDEWGEEWEEVANEEEFVGDDANEQEDYNLDSSSSEDEDAGDDEDAGEKELRKAERQERTKKRKTATNPFAARLAAASSRKRVKLDVPTTTTQSPPAGPGPSRPKKKSERASWIPTDEDGPIRTSSRKQTMANKEHTLAKLKEKDQRRDETLAMMKAAEARKAKDEPKPLTQAERLAEAARVERINKKTLHHWEEAEELRAAERQAKIDALKNRQIDGPFIRFYSGPAIWVDDKVKYTGKDAPKLEDLEDKLNKEMTASTSTENPSASVPEADQPTLMSVDQPQNHDAQIMATSQSPSMDSQPASIPASQPPIHDVTMSQELPFANNVMFAPPSTSDSFLFGMEQYTQPSQQQTSQAELPPNPFQTSQPDLPGNPFQASQPDLPPNPFLSASHSNLSDLSFTPSLFPQDQPPTTMSPQHLLAQFQKPPPPPPPPRRKVIRRALRNLLILSSFPNLDAAAAPTRARSTASLLKEKDKAALVQLSTAVFNWSVADAMAFVTAMLNAPKTKKEKEALAKSKKELCAVSNKEAKYRDPETGIAYRDSRAFGVLRGVVGGGFVWCGELGCYVGGRAKPMESRGKGFLGMAPAAGVPKRFLEM